MSGKSEISITAISDQIVATKQETLSLSTLQIL